MKPACFTFCNAPWGLCPRNTSAARLLQALLTPTEVQLAADINALGGQVLIALEDDPPSSTSSDGRQWAVAAASSLRSPATSSLQSPAFQKMMSFCLHTGLTPRPPGVRGAPVNPTAQRLLPPLQ